MLNDVLRHLDALVGFDTRNPPRMIGTDGIFDYLQSQLQDFQLDLIDHGAGAVSLLAKRGVTSRLFNVHLDTVPNASGWRFNPMKLRIDDGKAIGLGACDIKGAAACLLAASARNDGPVAMLFTTDEEANDARCVPAFLASDHGFTEAIVAEPTNAEAVLAHRGIASARIMFYGKSAHASVDDALSSSAVHRAMRWGTQAIAHAQSMASDRFGGLTGLRFNIGKIEGGIKANMVAAEAEVRFGFRPLPSQDTERLHDTFHALAITEGDALYEPTFFGAALPSGEIYIAENRRLQARDLADSLHLPIGNAVDFWTEAALFSAAGLIALVYGPGDIAQAHSADEWVSLEQLAHVATTYERMMVLS